MRIVETRGEKPAVVVEDDGEVARLRSLLAADRYDRLIENPRVPAAQRGLRRRRDPHGEAFGRRFRQLREIESHNWSSWHCDGPRAHDKRTLEL